MERGTEHDMERGLHRGYMNQLKPYEDGAAAYPVPDLDNGIRHCTRRRSYCKLQVTKQPGQCNPCMRLVEATMQLPGPPRPPMTACIHTHYFLGGRALTTYPMIGHLDPLGYNYKYPNPKPQTPNSM